jgi:hypothetical protein
MVSRGTNRLASLAGAYTVVSVSVFAATCASLIAPPQIGAQNSEKDP